MNEPQPLPASYTADILARVEELTRSKTDKARFYSDLLQIMLEAANSEIGVVWRQSNEDWAPVAQSGTTDQMEFHGAVAEFARDHRVPVIRSAPRQPRFGGTLVCLAAPLADDHRCFAVATIEVLADSPAAAESLLAILTAIAERVGKRHAAENQARTVEELARFRRAEKVIQGVSRQIELKPLAFDAVNRLRDYLGADRVSLAVKRGGECRVYAVSNQAVFDRRANVLRLMEQLAAPVAKTEEPLWYPHSETELPPKLRKLIERYFEASDTLGIGLVPLFGTPKRRIDPEDIAATIARDEEVRECVGVLILEGIERPLDHEDIGRKWNLVEPAVSSAVANARRYDGLFLMPVWRALGKFADLYRGHTQRKAIIITAIIAAALSSLVLIQDDFKVRGEGTIQPVARQHVYAATEGTIDELRVADGDRVRAGDLLMRLKNPQLDARIVELEGKLNEAESQLHTTTLQRVARSYATPQEERELVRTASNLEARIAGIHEQLAVLEKSAAQLKIESPADGQVVTWDVLQRLRNRPVKPGQRLLSIADPAKSWEIELRIPDKRSGYLLRQWETTGGDVTTSFVLSSQPTKVFTGKVLEVAPASNVDDKVNENVVRVRIQLSPEDIARMESVKPGITVIGHIHCGRATLGYCKLYEFFDWTQRMWFSFIG